jgi:hypothetical protein
MSESTRRRRSPRKRPDPAEAAPSGTSGNVAAVAMSWGARVRITVRVTIETDDARENALWIGLMGPGAWYDPSEYDLATTEKRFRALKYSGPHLLRVYTTGYLGNSLGVIRSADRSVVVRGKNRTINITFD